jgi:hypothetical protein
MDFNRKYLVLLALLAAGCGGGGYGGGRSGNNNPPSGMTNSSFVSFVKAQFAQTSDTTEPVEVNDKQFDFDDSETAFDDVLQ